MRTIGSGKPSLAIVTCVHGDEIVGRRIYNYLKKKKISQGSVLLLLANLKAMQRKRRFIRQDLNRSFPGRKKGVFEERLAAEILEQIRHCEYVLDIHATNSNIDALSIVTKKSRKLDYFLSKINVHKVAMINKKIFGGKEMISHVSAGVSLEYGPDKSGRNFKKIVSDINDILIRMKYIKGSAPKISKKSRYAVIGTFSVKKGFVQNKALDDFKKIKKGDCVGTVGKKKLFSPGDFYPLFLGKGRYKKTLCLMAKKIA